MKFIAKTTCAACLLGSITGVMAAGEEMQISTEVNSTAVGGGENIEVSAYLDSSKEKSNGLGVAVAYDSRKMNFEGFSYAFESGLLSESSESEPDRDDIDNNPETDRLVRIAWVDIDGHWSGIDQNNTHLLSVEFSTATDNDQSGSLSTEVSMASISTASSDRFATVRQAVNLQ